MSRGFMEPRRPMVAWVERSRDIAYRPVWNSDVSTSRPSPVLPRSTSAARTPAQVARPVV